MSNATTPDANKPDALWYTRCAVPTPLSFAAQFGWLEQEFAGDGIVIKSLRESNDPVQLASHFEHTLPHSFRQGGAVPPIWARGNGQQTRVIGLSWTDEYQALITLPQSGIRTLKDLRGRRIGLPLHETSIDHNRASALRAFKVALATVGVDLREVEQVDLPDARYPTARNEDSENERPSRRNRHTYANEVYALVRGEVDAVYVKDVRGAEVTHLLGAHVIFDLGFHPDPFIRVSNCAPRPLTVNADTIEKYPDLVDRFLRRVIAAGEWARTHPSETVTYIARETGWSEAWVRKAFGDQVHQQLTLAIDETRVNGLDTLKNFLHEHGFLQHDFDMRQWVDPAPFERAARQRVASAA
jgi:ABC-type nitrate/sulfonate/bicarbonate transport system substrate-binding protein